MEFASGEPGPGATGRFSKENPVRTTGGMDGFSTIWSGQNDVSPRVVAEEHLTAPGLVGNRKAVKDI